MNDRLKFKAWDTHKKQWTTFEMGWMFDSTSGEIWFVPITPLTSFGIDSGIEIVSFTGLKDKNGKDIWEGDILRVDWDDARYPVHTIGPVAWDEENARWHLGEGGWSKHDAAYYFEVIGNKYEHPQLLEEVSHE